MKNDIMLICLLLGLVLGVGTITPFKKTADAFHKASNTAYQMESASLSGVIINKIYGGTDSDQSSALLQTADGGYAITGRTASYGAGSNDMWLVKTDADGNKEWDKTYGGTEFDCGTSLLQTADGGFAVTGRTTSYGAGGWDSWLVKTDANGNHEWNKTHGGRGDDCAYSFLQTVRMVLLVDGICG
jgi:hypothetical protein